MCFKGTKEEDDEHLRCAGKFFNKSLRHFHDAGSLDSSVAWNHGGKMVVPWRWGASHVLLEPFKIKGYTADIPNKKLTHYTRIGILILAHRIRVWYVYLPTSGLNLWVNVGKYASPMDPMHDRYTNPYDDATKLAYARFVVMNGVEGPWNWPLQVELWAPTYNWWPGPTLYTKAKQFLMATFQLAWMARCFSFWYFRG